MTKKEFKELCSFHEYGGGMKKRNAIYCGYKPEYGFKYMVKGSVINLKKNELFNVLYDWVMNEKQPPYYVEYKYAHTDDERFKVSLMG